MNNSKSNIKRYQFQNNSNENVYTEYDDGSGEITLLAINKTILVDRNDKTKLTGYITDKGYVIYDQRDGRPTLFPKEDIQKCLTHNDLMLLFKKNFLSETKIIPNIEPNEKVISSKDVDQDAKKVIKLKVQNKEKQDVYVEYYAKDGRINLLTINNKVIVEAGKNNNIKAYYNDRYCDIINTQTGDGVSLPDRDITYSAIKPVIMGENTIYKFNNRKNKEEVYMKCRQSDGMVLLLAINDKAILDDEKNTGLLKASFKDGKYRIHNTESGVSVTISCVEAGLTLDAIERLLAMKKQKNDPLVNFGNLQIDDNRVNIKPQPSFQSNQNLDCGKHKAGGGFTKLENGKDLYYSNEINKKGEKVYMEYYHDDKDVKRVTLITINGNLVLGGKSNRPLTAYFDKERDNRCRIYNTETGGNVLCTANGGVTLDVINKALELSQDICK